MACLLILGLLVLLAVIAVLALISLGGQVSSILSRSAPRSSRRPRPPAVVGAGITA